MWLPGPTERLQAFYASTDTTQGDDATTLLEDALQTLEQIQAACRKYGVRARVVRAGKLIGEVTPTGDFVAVPPEA